MARDAYMQHRADIDALIAAPDAGAWWQRYPDEVARALWAGLHWLSRDPESPREVAQKAEALWEAFLQRQG